MCEVCIQQIAAGIVLKTERKINTYIYFNTLWVMDTIKNIYYNIRKIFRGIGSSRPRPVFVVVCK